MDHWRRDHKQMCKKVHRGGNAEQYHADKKYKEAVAAAVEACADDTIDPSATLDDLREAVTTLEDMERIARRVFGMANPFTAEIAVELRQARANLRHREARQPAKNLAEEVD